MIKTKSALSDNQMVVRAIKDSFIKLSPKVQAENHVMLLVYISAILTSLLWVASLSGVQDVSSGYTLAIAIILWLTCIFANFAEAIAEGRGKAQADALRAAKKDVEAYKLHDVNNKEKLQEFLENNKWQIVTIVIAIIVTLIFVLPTRHSDSDTFEISSSSTSQISKVSTSVPQVKSSVTRKEIFVDIKGAVKHPGLYKAKPNQRLAYIIQQAGGLENNADVSKLNYAHKLSDQMMIYVPKQGENYTGDVIIELQSENTMSSDTSNSNTTEETEDNNKINLNTATKEQLTQLNGIGDKKAELIISYRDEHGKFKTIDELRNVSGIGDKTFAAISDKLTV